MRMKDNVETIYFNFTGNPFVDTGLAVITARAGKNRITELTNQDLISVLGDGKWLAQVNRQLKAFNMVASNNSPLLNTSSNPSLRKRNRDKLKADDDKGWNDYLSILQDLLRDLNEAHSNRWMCECCGERPSSHVLLNKGIEIAREWFPLAGSIGNDAQALPAASRAPRICSLCLLTIQFLPLGVMVLNGKLACFQSTRPEITHLIVEDIYHDTINKLHSLSSVEKLSALGQGQGSQQTTLALIKVMNNLQVNKRMLDLPPHTSLNIWLFTNSGAAPDCEVIEIPSSSLEFLWETTRKHRTEMDQLLRKEGKKRPNQQLLECIRRRSEYRGLYPYKGQEPASKELFKLYQVKVIEQPPEALRIAENIAFSLSNPSSQVHTDEKLLNSLKKESAWESKDKSLRIRLKGLIAEMVEEGLLTLEEYVSLFPVETVRPLRTQAFGWKWIWFFLNHQQLYSERQAIIHRGGDKMLTNPKIKGFAYDIFDYYQRERGLPYIKKRILDEFKRGEITTRDLQRWFFNLAEVKEGYTNEEWDNLCRDENGNNVTYEVRFQLRLELVNLYRNATNDKVTTN